MILHVEMLVSFGCVGLVRRLGHRKHCDTVIKVLLVLQLGKLLLRIAVFVHILDLRIDGFCE